LILAVARRRQAAELHHATAILKLLGDVREQTRETGKREILRCCEMMENYAPGQRPLLR